MDPIEKYLLLDIITYLKSRGREIASLTSSAGQEKVKIEIKSFFWYHIRSRQYPRFMDLYNLVKEKRSIKFKEYTIEVTDKYIIIPLDFIKEVINNPQKILKEVYSS